ncbi:5-formyltetrahydrofolate cyclo-ligase [Halpernia frigidisoli]|uniref:5-formyltetrahydrofolate cyclo-ligase n=1 Tax=Halpernia frigidisoli TaxID=1125876 RepID=A0A1I3J877_9FLAO|nr:5-formyltetrahydrofolate cyclo-ligase [Halpernia frigidisoli]SFI56452.1 5-formyltetrahydrofolate cyclo-ligase [Halpernia frigidisoli]
MKKIDLRKLYQEKRNALSDMDISLLSDKIFENFIKEFKPVAGHKVHVFMSLKKFNEIQTDLFIEKLWKIKAKVYVPKVVFDKMKSVEINDKTVFTKNKWDILEPIKPSTKEVDFDFVITPLLYCDKNGNRIGYGKGFYDRFFKEINSDAIKIGVNYFDTKENVSDFNEKDVKLDVLITPKQIFKF